MKASDSCKIQVMDLFTCPSDQRILYNLIHRKIVCLEVICHDLPHGSQGNRSHQLRPGNTDAVAGSFPFYGFRHHRNGCLFIMGQVHGNLDHALIGQGQTDGTHIPETTVDVAYAFGDAFSDGEIRGCEVNIKSHQGETGGDLNGTALGHELGRPSVRLPLGLLDFLGKRLVLTHPNLGKTPPFRPGRGVFVKINRYTQVLTDGVTEIPGDVYGFLFSNSSDGYERDHVHGALTGVGSLLMGHIDQAQRSFG